ncbi:single-stranded DNA-binding protein [Candidatus Woesebacteria bacterium]|nr:single-stranded DNA-binding protein [Candidatus Woesebacteria bacterium]MCD8506708.1 single-stranded DNA-binding protein [Candidatus Woesebacteria bacterium]MCD8527614.1 single-stranded DNA-binding protein [Candidatus Woesebacteria bacterium]MCD8546414.1 single-stranded DNA-binding protein [Candidatus Woesebacteria bacterium]
MATRSLNKVQLIGNIVRDPEVRFTPKNTAVANFTVATNRTWSDANGQTQEDAEFTRCVAWGKLAEIVGQILSKGRKVYVEGRLQTRSWETKEGEKRYTTEVVADQVIALDGPGDGDGGSSYSGSSSSNSNANDKSDDLQVDDNVADLDDLADDIPF